MIIDSHVHISIYEGRVNNLEEAYKLLLKNMADKKIDYAIIIPDNVEDDKSIAGLDKSLLLTKGSNNLFFLGSPRIINKKAPI